jgi:hypothetical protein
MIFFISFQKEKSSPILCSRCEETKATVYCEDCGLPFCDGDSEDIHKKGKYKSHKRVPIGDAPNVISKPHMCEKHQREELKLFCVSCEKPCCYLCAISPDHKQNDVLPLEDFCKKVLRN